MHVHLRMKVCGPGIHHTLLDIHRYPMGNQQKRLVICKNIKFTGTSKNKQNAHMLQVRATFLSGESRNNK